MTQINSQCSSCKHLKPDWTCAAFPTGVPDQVAFNEVDHRDEFPGDGGIRWQPVPGEAHPFAEE